jgi:predicted RNA-binding Zn-ribbon protein involved in translation (DUF1610 family)
LYRATANVLYHYDMKTQLSAPEEAHVSQSCSACDVNWWSHHAKHERCPMCGGSTIWTGAPASDDADLLYRIAHAEAQKRDLYAHFDRYYAGRDQEHRAA